MNSGIGVMVKKIRRHVLAFSGHKDRKIGELLLKIWIVKNFMRERMGQAHVYASVPPV
jgi:hypothetical protein